MPYSTLQTKLAAKMDSHIKLPASLGDKPAALHGGFEQCQEIELAENRDKGIPRDESSNETFLATEKSLVRKLDCTLMPTVFILYLFNYLDRNNIA